MVVGHEGVWVVSRFLGKWKGETLQRRGGREGATPPLSSHVEGVRWLGRPLYSHPRAARKACLLCPFHHGGRP